MVASESVNEPTSNDESLGALAKQLIAQLSQQNDSESKASSHEDDSLPDDMDASRSIGSWMAASPLWGQVEEPERTKEPQRADDSWSAAALLRQEQESHDAHAVAQTEGESDEDHGGTMMMMSDWPSKASLPTPDSANRYSHPNHLRPARINQSSRLVSLNFKPSVTLSKRLSQPNRCVTSLRLPIDLHHGPAIPTKKIRSKTT